MSTLSLEDVYSILLKKSLKTTGTSLLDSRESSNMNSQVSITSQLTKVISNDSYRKLLKPYKWETNQTGAFLLVYFSR